IQATLDRLHTTPQRSAQSETANDAASSASRTTSGFTDNRPGPKAPEQQRRQPANGSAHRSDASPRGTSGFTPPRWLADRSAEWWLSALGVVFLVVALFL